MATLKQRIKKKNTSGTYDTLHLETNSNLVLMNNGNNLQYEMYNHTHTKSQITDFPSSMTPTSHTHTKSQITDFPTSMAPTSHNHGAGDINSGTLSVSRGGTGRSTLTSGYFLRGNGTSAITMSSVADVKSALGVKTVVLPGTTATFYGYTFICVAYDVTNGIAKYISKDQTSYPNPNNGSNTSYRFTTSSLYTNCLLPLHNQADSSFISISNQYYYNSSSGANTGYQTVSLKFQPVDSGTCFGPWKRSLDPNVSPSANSFVISSYNIDDNNYHFGLWDKFSWATSGYPYTARTGNYQYMYLNINIGTTSISYTTNNINVAIQCYRRV